MKWVPLPLIVLASLSACSGEDRGLNPSRNRSDSGVSANGDAATNEDASTTPDSGVSAPDTGVQMGDPSVRELSLGTVHIENGASEAVEFDLPEGVTSFMLIIDGPDNAWYVPQRLDGPGGMLVSDDDSMVTQIERFLLGPFAAQFKSPNRVVQDLGIAASLFPNNPGIEVRGGHYSLVIGGLVPAGQGAPFTGDVEVTIYYRQGVPNAGRLDVKLYFTGAGGITAADAPTNTLIQNALMHLRTIYAQASIDLGAIEYHDADSQYQTIRNIDGTGGDLEALFQLSDGHGPGLHFFFIDRFEAAFPGATVAGIAGGLPGAPRHPGSVGAGVAVALNVIMNDDAATLAHVMAHEGGHWLGLFHTSEITGTEDQHPETPGGMAGNTYLMYPAVGGGTQITTSQGVVLRNHVEVVAQ